MKITAEDLEREYDPNVKDTLTRRDNSLVAYAAYTAGTPLISGYEIIARVKAARQEAHNLLKGADTLMALLGSAAKE